MSNPSDRLLHDHQRRIRESAISPEVGEARGYWSATEKKDLLDLGFSQYQAIVPALVIPIHTASGEVTTHQIRPDRPRITEKGRELKYETPKGSRLCVDVPPTVRDRLEDPGVALWITEGARKADSAATAGLCCVALMGVWGWRGKNSVGGKTALSDWASIALNGRHVYIAFDSDVATKESVASALVGLVGFLEGKGAIAHIVQLQPGPNDEKVGLDDYLAGGGDIDALRDSADTKGFLEKSRKPAKLDSEVDSLMNGSGVEVFFHTPSGDPYAVVSVDGVPQTVAIRSERFRVYLAADYFKREGTVPSKEALSQTRLVMEGKASFGGEEVEVYTRIAPGPDNTMYYDLADSQWRAVRIDGSGWNIVDRHPIRFRRPAGLLELPEPAGGGSLDELRQFVNVHDDDFPLLLGWLISAVRYRGPYPILGLHGEHGSAKSTTSRVLKELIDPNKSDLRAQPRNLQDLAIAAENSWCLVFDNLSGISGQLSDGMCRTSTGGGFATRRLYTDFDEVIFDAQRPMAMNGISDIASRADLIDRMIVLNLPRLTSYREEREFWEEFEVARPRIFGALLTAVSSALRYERETKVGANIRMSDAARWVTAAERALDWEPGTFVEAYKLNRQDANVLALEASLVADAVRCLIETMKKKKKRWRGTAQELLAELESIVDYAVTKQKDWPKSARALSVELRRLAPNLRRTGVELEFGVRENSKVRRRMITIRRVGGAKEGEKYDRTCEKRGEDGECTATPLAEQENSTAALPGLKRSSADRPLATDGKASGSDDPDGSDGRSTKSGDPGGDAIPEDWEEL